MIDVTFDVRDDAGAGDPDVTSPTLRRYHQLLWSKPLPDGTPFDLDISHRRRSLAHSSARGDLVLGSDTCVPTFRSSSRMASVIEQVDPSVLDEFERLSHTIGGMLVFPSVAEDGLRTIDVARGLTRAIADRLDLTLECIRLHYLGEPSPMDRVLTANADFFALFESFAGYVDFFLLQDLVDDGAESVRFMLDFRGFDWSALPSDADAYETYRARAVAFLTARNHRIGAWARDHEVG